MHSLPSSVHAVPEVFFASPGQAAAFPGHPVLPFSAGVLGLSAMIPLRRLLIVRSADELPLPGS